MRISPELEYQILKEYELNKIVSQIARKIHRSNNVIYRVLEKNNVILKNKRFKRGGEIEESRIPELISKYLNGDGICDCVKIFNTSETVIERTLRKNGIKIRTLEESHKVHKKVRNKYKINENFFDNPESWTEKQAWVLGWLASDGTNSTKYHLFSVGVVETDKIIIETIRNLLESERPIRHRGQRKSSKPCCSMDVYSKKLSNTLYQLGIVDRKSLIYEFPKFLRPDLIRHFIRGYFEGDGCIHRKKDTNYCRFTIVGTKIFLTYLSYIIDSQINIGIKNVNLNINDVNHKYYTGITSAYGVANVDNLYKIYQYLYKDCNYLLPRKKEKFDQFVEHLKTKPEYAYLNPTIV